MSSDYILYIQRHPGHTHCGHDELIHKPGGPKYFSVSILLMELYILRHHDAPPKIAYAFRYHNCIYEAGAYYFEYLYL